ncbi:hypothetical protein GCM10029964_104700 [Kibdelosporangium lantanae]
MSGQPEVDDVIRVAVVDDHPIARYGIEHVLGRAPGIQVVLSAGSVRELAGTLPARTVLDVLILDLYLGTDQPALAAVTELAASTRVLVMSASGRPADVLGAIRAGASGYITKGSGADLIISTVETVAAGGFLLSAELADVIQAELIRQSPVVAPATVAPRLSPGRRRRSAGWRGVHPLPDRDPDGRAETHGRHLRGTHPRQAPGRQQGGADPSGPRPPRPGRLNPLFRCILPGE